MTATVAAYMFSALAAAVVAFQVALAFGMPWAELTWGCRFPGKLPGRMRAVAVVTALLLIVFAVIVLARTGLVLPGWESTSRTVVWVVVAYAALGVVANAATPSRWERIIWLPVILVMLGCSLIVALS